MTSEACCSPSPPAAPAAPTPVGKEETLAGTKAYVTGSPTAPRAVILISDLFGYEAPQLRKLADKVAKVGFFVVVPDLLQGDPFYGNFETDLESWLAKHPATGVPVESTRSLVEAVKDKGAGAVGCAGFCWGAKVAVCLGKESKDVRAVVQLHPSLIEASDYEQVVVPIAVLASPHDGVEQYEELLASRTEVKSFVKVFEGVNHGWTVRYEESDETAVAKAIEAHKLMLDWFAKYL